MRRRFAAAAAAIGLVGGGGLTSEGAHVIDVRTSPVQSDPDVVVLTDMGVGKHALAAPGDVIDMQVWARVSGTDGIHNETLTLCGASIASGFGGLMGNLAHWCESPFNGPGFSNGTIQDFDSDGDLDVGSTPATLGTGKIAYRASPSAAVTSPVNTQTAEILIGSFTVTVTSGVGDDTVVQIIPRGGVGTAVAQWTEDGNPPQMPGTGTFGANPPGVLVEGVPELSGVGLLGIAGVGLLARRARNRS